MAENMTCGQILKDLKYCDNEFPQAAIQAARLNRDEIILGLIAEVHDATTTFEDSGGVSTWGHIAAIFLLSEFGAKEGFPAILMSMCSSGADQLWGDFITEDLAHVTARLAEGPDQLALAINDPEVYEYVRGALVKAVFGMVCDEKISRETAVQFLRERLIAAMHEKDSHVVTKSVEMLGQLLATEAHHEVKAAERSNLVDEEWIGEGYFKEQLARGPAAFEEARQLYLKYNAKNATDGLQKMPWFNQKRKGPDTLDEVLKKISEPFSAFPADAVRWARKHREEITPHLIRLIEGVPEYAERRTPDSKTPEAYGHIIALYLLTEFGVQEILPTLLNILSDSRENIVDCFHDVIDRDMAQILGRLADEPSQLRTLVFNPDANEIVRRDAVEAIVWMVTEGKLDRNAAIALLLEWLKDSRDNTDTILTTWITFSLLDLGAANACQTLVEACDSGDMDEMWICSEEIEDALSNGNNTFSQTLENHHLGRIEHTVVELSDWDWDGTRAASSNLQDAWADGDDDEYDDEDDDEDDLSTNEDFRKMWLSMRQQFSPEQLMELVESDLPMSPSASSNKEYHQRTEVTAPIRHDGPKVGRNDPCPCGSGKKYKKCCAKSDA